MINNRLNIIKESYITNKKVLRFIVFLLVLLSLASFVYYGYIVGNKLYVFNDIAGDSYYQTTPLNINMAYELQDFGRILKWNWSSFLGVAQSTNFDLLNSWTYMFGVDNVGRMQGIMQFLKVILAGSLFYCYTGKLKFSYITRLLTSLGFAFCGHIIARGTWSPYPNEVVCAGLLLVGLECVIAEEKKGNFIFPFAIAMMCFSGSSYREILYFFISIGYFMFRLYEEYGNGFIKSNRKKIRNFFLLIVLGIGLSAFAFFPSLIGTLDSSRVETVIASTKNGNNMNFLSSLDTIFTSIARAFSNDLTGNALEYSGWRNYLEGPVFYCGILILFGIPYAFNKNNIKNSVLYICALLFAVLYVVIEPLRYAANAFDSNTFKLSSFWIIIVLLYIGGRGLDNVFNENKKKWKAAVFSGVLILLIVFMNCIKPDMLDLHYVKIVIIMILIYSILLFNKFEIKYKKIILLIIFVCELYYQSYPAVNTRMNLSKENYEHYLNKTVQNELSKLKVDSNDLFRVEYPTKDFGSPWKYNYMGTRAYIGGSAFSDSVQDFVTGISNDYMEQLGYSRKIYGFYGNNIINTFLGVKYLIMDNASEYQYIPYGYKKISEIESISIYENEYFLPLFYTYNKVISNEDFLKLNKEDRRSILLKAIVLEDCKSTIGNFETNNTESNMLYKQEHFDLGYGKEYNVKLGESINSEYLIVRLKIKTEPMEMQNLNLFVRWGELPSQSMQYMTATGSDELVFSIPYDSINELSFSSNFDGPVEITDFSVQGVDDIYFNSYKEDIEKLKLSNIDVGNFEGDSFELIANINEGGEYLFTSIPYDQNWKVYVDGKEIEIIKANLGFTAFQVPKGSHNIKFKYQMKSNQWYAISIMSFLILVLYSSKEHWIKSKGKKEEKL